MQNRWHLITGEYPPEKGGVGDYTQLLAAALAGEEDEVHVWCPGFSAPERSSDGVVIHRQLGGMASRDLGRVGEQLDQFPASRKLLVQWVPHAYGYRSMNFGFCWWLWRRAARHGDQVELMVHEPYLSFRAAAWRQNCAALVHRLMTILVLRAAARVWISIPEWESYLRPYAFGRPLEFRTLPIFSNVPQARDSSRYRVGSGTLIGHFGTYGSLITALLKPILLALAADPVEQTILLMGEHSQEFRAGLISEQPRLAHVIQATGRLSAGDLAQRLAGCDLLVQPYPDGVSSRRGSFMAGLANGRPIVTTRGHLTEPLWTETGAVEIVPAGDTEAFVQAARRLRADAAERQRLGYSARTLYRERFDISHTVAALRLAEAPKDVTCAFS
jgi:glycosyltransferase involved in cell wall biosynthesis